MMNRLFRFADKSIDFEEHEKENQEKLLYIIKVFAPVKYYQTLISLLRSYSFC